MRHDNSKTYESADQLGLTLGIPENRIRDLANQGLIPSLLIGKHLRFCQDDVERALRELAEQRAANLRQSTAGQGVLA
jgi:hypothetical protein